MKTFYYPTRILAIIAACNLIVSTISAKEKPKKVIVFVCEHGVAKSVVAAAHFNKLVQERNLPYIAIARGTEPQDSLMMSVVKGLHNEHLAASQKPAPKLSQADCNTALRSVFFCPIPPSYQRNTNTERWQNVPPVSEDYNRARDSIVADIRHLLDELAAATSSSLPKKKP